jgi:hypothetical protein
MKKEKVVGTIFCEDGRIINITDREVTTWLNSFTNDEWIKMLNEEKEKYLKQKEENDRL